MMFAAGDHLGPYEIQAVLGAGSMGEVYRARDPRLGRDVAIKVLPALFSTDPDRLRRFEQEARAAAALSHPNILAVYDIGTHEGLPYVVSELLDGQTLREQLAAGPLSVRKAVEYAVQIAHGLAAAHEKGIVHRDLKPENLLITGNGRVKIVEFGLAKLIDGPVSTEVEGDATHTSITTPGTILGTIGYMSPEQIRGLPTDNRSDLFAFGMILYEMLSGARAFRGETTADTMMAILKDPPSPLPAERNVPSALERIVDRCLEKSPAARFQSAGDLAFALEGLSSYSESVQNVPAVRSASARPMLSWTVAGLFALTTVVLAAVAYQQRTPSNATVPTYRSSILPPEHVTFNTATAAGGLVLSPDGQRLAFTAAGQEGRVMLWVRSLDGLTAQPLAGTEGAYYPFWSPDSRSIAFFAGGKLKKIDLAGSSPATLCDTPRSSVLAAGGSWNRDGVILFSQATEAIYRVSALGGTPAPATTLDLQAGETQHWAPFFLPDGKHFLYLAVGSKNGGPDDPNGVYVGTIDSKDRTLVLAGGANAKYAGGYLIFPRDRVLMAQPFDVSRLTLSGDAVPVADQLATSGPSGRTGAFSVSQTGVLAYQAGFEEVRSQLGWVDRAGKPLGKVGGEADYTDLELSPNREQAAVSVLDAVRRTRDVYLFDVIRNVRTRFTSDPADERTSIWSPDGKRVVYNARRKGYFDLYQKDPSGATDEEPLLADTKDKTPDSWSPDGQVILFSTSPPLSFNNSALWLLSVSDKKTVPFLQTSFNETSGRFSPDGRWVAYVSNETGSQEVYVTHYPGPRGKWPISAGGGIYPRWRKDGREIFYVSHGMLMAAGVNGQGTEFESTAAKELFDVHLGAREGRYPYRRLRRWPALSRQHRRRGHGAAAHHARGELGFGPSQTVTRGRP